MIHPQLHALGKGPVVLDNTETNNSVILHQDSLLVPNLQDKCFFQCLVCFDVTRAMHSAVLSSNSPSYQTNVFFSVGAAAKHGIRTKFT